MISVITRWTRDASAGQGQGQGRGQTEGENREMKQGAKNTEEVKRRSPGQNECCEFLTSRARDYGDSRKERDTGREGGRERERERVGHVIHVMYTDRQKKRMRMKTSGQLFS